MPSPPSASRQIEKPRPHLAVLPPARGIFDIDAVGRGVLGDDEQLLYPGGDESFRLAQHVRGRPRDEVAAQLRDDAEGAAIVAALGNLQIGVVARRELDALRRHEIDEGIVPRRRGAVHRIEHALVLLRAGDGEHVRETASVIDSRARRPCSR